MKKRHYVGLITVSVIILASGLSWLTCEVLPNIWIVHLTPLEERVHPIPRDGSAILVFKNSKIEGHRVIESAKIGWSGLGDTWPLIVVGMILGAVAGYLMARPQQKFVEFANKSLTHSNEILRIAEQKESDAAREVSKGEDMQYAAYVRNSETAKERNEVQLMRKDAEQQMAIADEKIRQSDAKDKELSKARAKIRRLEGRTARQTENND